MTDNRNFAQFNAVFRLACELAKVPATKRQASKYRRNRGMASKSRVAAEARFAK
jgi:hypothetical protein